MSTASTESIMNLPNDRTAFLLQLPRRIAAIEENWAGLRGSEWTDESLDNLYQRVREISEGASRFGLHQLSESGFSLEVYLSSFVGSTSAPDEASLREIDGLLRNLRAATTESAHVTVKDDPEAPLPVYMLGNRNADMAALAQVLEAQQVPLRRFEEVERLLNALDEHLPEAIVVDTAMLPRLSKLSAELVRLKSQSSIELPLVFISASKNLQLRVDAIRAGGDAYFVSPIDAEDVAQRIRAYGQQHADRPFRVMVVEDDPTQAEFAASILRKANMHVTTVTEPIKVLDELRRELPDLLLMDIYMPEINGIELTTIIREYDEYVGIPIVFLSGEQNADRQMDALSVGGDDFVAKPIRPRQLLTVVENRIRRTRRLMKAVGSHATHDKVTGLLSKRQFLEQIEKVLAADPSHTHPAGVLVLAPDDLEALRKRLGMGGVDHLIAELGQSVRGPLDERDAAARLDDHMLGILVRRDSNNQINDVCARLHEHIESQRFESAGDAGTVTIGIGVCLLDENLDDPAGLVSRARTALDKAQQLGRRQSHIHTFGDDVDRARGRREDDVSAALRECLHKDCFKVTYQPLLDLQTRGSESYEIILRAPTPKGDLLRERDFRDAAEKAGLSGDIDRWLLERAIDILRKRRSSGRQTRIFVHQSAASMSDPNHPAWLLGRLRAQQMVGTGLVVDFRLTDLSADIRGAQKNIAALREFDVEVSLSRFPEKEAAFKVLRFVKANYLAIAPRLLKADRKTIGMVIEQAHKAGVKVIVPNIDDPRSIDLHWSSGADYLQGNFIQRPLDNMDYDFSQVVI